MPIIERAPQLLDFPWPYRGMVAICSDTDLETPRHFALVHRFLNTQDMTPLGRGLGLDIADSFWFYAPIGGESGDEQFAFFAGMDWQSRSRFADRILEGIRCGWVDTLHAYGNFNDHPPGGPGAFTREHAERGFALLERAGLTVPIWSNHGNRHNVQNMLEDDCFGDLPGHPLFHSDLLPKLGTCFVWSSKMSGEFRRDVPVALDQLRDGQKIWRFSRQDYVEFAEPAAAYELERQFGAIVRPQRDGAIAVVWHPQLLHIQLSRQNLAELSERGGYAILGQHLGRTRQPGEILTPEAVEALQRLEAAQAAGDILVARTSRLLDFAVAHQGLRFAAACDGAGKVIINITGIEDPVRGDAPPPFDRFRGLTFEIAGAGPAELRLRGETIAASEIVEHRFADRRIVGIRWFAADHTDYAADWEFG